MTEPHTMLIALLHRMGGRIDFTESEIADAEQLAQRAGLKVERQDDGDWMKVTLEYET